MNARDGTLEICGCYSTRQATPTGFGQKPRVDARYKQATPLGFTRNVRGR